MKRHDSGITGRPRRRVRFGSPKAWVEVSKCGALDAGAMEEEVGYQHLNSSL